MDRALKAGSPLSPLWGDPAMDALIIQSLKQVSTAELEQICQYVVEERGIETLINFYTVFNTVFKTQTALQEAVKTKQEKSELKERRKNLQELIAHLNMRLQERRKGIVPSMPKVGATPATSIVDPRSYPEKPNNPNQVAIVIPLWGDPAMEALVIQSIKDISDKDLEEFTSFTIEDRGIEGVLNFYVKLKAIFASQEEFIEAVKRKQEQAQMDERKSNLRALIENFRLKLSDRKSGITPVMPKLPAPKVPMLIDPKAYSTQATVEPSVSVTACPLWGDEVAEKVLVLSIQHIDDGTLEELSRLKIPDRGIDSILELYIKLKSAFPDGKLVELVKKKQESAHINERKANLRALIENFQQKLEKRR